MNLVTYHLPRNTVTKLCKHKPKIATHSDLFLATRFVAFYLLIKVERSRSMTYQYLRVEMVKAAKNNDGFIDQKKICQHVFDLAGYICRRQVLDSYIAQMSKIVYI